MVIATPLLLATSVLSALSQRARLGYPSGAEAEVLFKLVAANLVAFLACWLLVVLFNSTLLASKETKGTALPLVLLLSFVIGVTKGYVTGFVALGSEVYNTFDEAIGLKWLQTGILGTFLLPALALLGHGLERVRLKSELLLAERVQTLLGQVSLDQSAGTDLLEQFKADALEQINNLERRLKTGSGGVELVSEGVRDLIEAHVRPLSHSIAKERQRLVLPLNLEWGIRAVFRGPVVGFLLAYFLIFVTLFMGYLQVDDIQRAFSHALLTSVIIGAICTTILLFRPRSLSTAVLLLLGSTAIASLLGIAASEALIPSQNPIDIVSLGLVVWILVLQNILSVVLSFVIARQNRLLDDELGQVFAQSDLDVRAKKVVREITNRNLAQYFHSDVQNKLLSTALLLESEHEDPAESIAKLREVIEALDGKTQSSLQFTWESLESTISEHWDGFIEVNFHVDPTLRKTLRRPNSLIFEILMEALSNALRHGRASCVDIELSSAPLHPQPLEIRVADDGLGPRNGKAGLGSNLLEVASRGNWSLQPLPGGGSLLVCTIPMA
jgi:signal transduction histidine kinase